MEEPAKALLKTKHHYEILDGLRGVAALSVVTFHFMEWVYSDYSKNFIAHGFLAVDFFFCLSGFVIGYAYDDRLAKMGIIEFFKSRLIRLHPMVVFGSILGLLALLFDPFAAQPALYSVGKLALLLLASVLLIPLPIMTDRSFNNFGLNAPAWSLFWEYVANIFYAFILHKITRRWLISLTIIFAALLCFVAYQAGNLLGGWDGKTFWHGGARVSFSFLAGLLIYRSDWLIKNKLGFAGMALLLLLSFLSPFSKWNWVTEPLIVILYFPFIIILGVGAALTPAIKKLCTFLGKMSYPLYMTHYAALWIFGNYYGSHKPATPQLAGIIISSIIILLGISWLVMVFYDIPVRRYLSEKRRLV